MVQERSEYPADDWSSGFHSAIDGLRAEMAALRSEVRQVDGELAKVKHALASMVLACNGSACTDHERHESFVRHFVTDQIAEGVEPLVRHQDPQVLFILAAFCLELNRKMSRMLQAADILGFDGFSDIAEAIADDKKRVKEAYGPDQNWRRQAEVSEEILHEVVMQQDEWHDKALEKSRRSRMRKGPRPE